jgi:hypothetical protein
MQPYSFDDSDNPIMIEVTPVTLVGDDTTPETYRGIFDQAGEVVANASEEAIQTAFRLIWTMARNTGWMIRDLKQHEDQESLNQVAVEFGLNFSGEGQVFVAKAEAAASIKVSLKWEPKA